MAQVFNFNPIFVRGLLHVPPSTRKEPHPLARVAPRVHIKDIKLADDTVAMVVDIMEDQDEQEFLASFEGLRCPLNEHEGSDEETYEQQTIGMCDCGAMRPMSECCGREYDPNDRPEGPDEETNKDTVWPDFYPDQAL